MEQEYKFKQDQSVQYSYGGLEGVGKVKGVATAEMVVIGAMYIVDLGEVVSEYYPFSCIVVPSHALTAI